ncbi:unnamed protein product [Thlaspi arvense]|uniref:C2H2-type domain-containing protein n=1 Tax=Thlaspi arvense TaxID=13288 RepID=A0AAU9RP34_THLAR|nr:unnamed protein product [Thlaspi arvense]
MGVKDASDKKILVDMLLWAVDNPAPANIMLISGDRDFSNALHQLSMRRYTILLAQPPRASAPLVAAAKYVWLWTSLASGGPPLTSVESSRLLNNGRCHVSNPEVSKDPVPEQVQSCKPTGSTSDAGDTKDLKTRENQRGSPRETKMLQNGRGAASESVASCDNFQKFTSHLSDKGNTSQGALVASRKTQANVSAKPVQEAELLEPVLCTVCNIICSSKDAYAKHKYGKRHRNNLELQSVKSENMSRGPAALPNQVLEKPKNMRKSREGRSKPNADFACRLCNVTCQAQTVFDSHLRGQRHASMLSQSEAMLDILPFVQALIDFKKLEEKGVREKDQPREAVAEPKPSGDFACLLCNALIGSKKLQEESVGEKDKPRETIATPKPNADHALSDLKKLQEKGVGEKDQPRETVAESQLQSQNAQKNTKKCLEMHVAIANQSEALIDSKKLQEEGVGVKDQGREAIAEPQLQSQNTQENPTFFEKQNKELGEICGTSENSVKEPFPSTKDRVETVIKQLTRECFDGLFKPVNQSNGATEHSGEAKKKQKEEMVRRAITTATKAASVASDDAHSSVSTNLAKEPEILQLVWCQVCQISCYDKVAFANHIYGKKHRQKLEMHSAKYENMSKGPATLCKESVEKTKKALCNNQTAFDSQLKSQNQVDMKALFVDSRRTRQEFEALVVESRKIREESDREKEAAEVHALVKKDDHGAQEDKEEVKEINAITENLVRVFTEPNRESKIPKESRGCLDVIPERVQVPQEVNVTKKLEDESKHTPEPENERAGLNEHPGEAVKTEEMKGKVDSFWSRLWGKKS